jgi:hypothetical protein
MKQSYIFTAILCCLLLFAGLNAAAQEKTTPLPTPDKGASALPTPDKGVSAPPAPDRAKSILPDVAETRVQAPQSGRSASQAPAAAAPAAAAPAASAAAAPAAAAGNTGTGGSAPQAAAADQSAPAPAGIPSKGLFWGAMAGGSMYNYEKSSEIGLPGDIHGRGGFSGGLLLGYDFGLLAGQAEVLVTGDNAKYESDYYNPNDHDRDLSGTTIQIPLMLKLDLHWRRIMLQPQAGLYLNLSLGDLNYKEYYGGGNMDSGTMEYSNPLFGAMFGAALGVRIGRGYLFLDSRYAINFGDTKIDGVKAYSREALMFHLGYQYYFKGKN